VADESASPVSRRCSSVTFISGHSVSFSFIDFPLNGLTHCFSHSAYFVLPKSVLLKVVMLLDVILNFLFVFS